MKWSLVLALLIPVALPAQVTPKKFRITGSVKHMGNEIGWVHFSYRSNGARIHDSAAVKNGKYSYSGELVEPVLITLYPAFEKGTDGKTPALNYNRDYAFVFAQPGKIKVSSSDSLSNVTVKGSPSQKEYNKLNELLKPLETKREELIQQWIAYDKKGDEANKKEISDKIDAIDEEERNKKGDFLKNDPGNLIAVYLLKDYAGWDINPEEVEPLFNKLPENYQQYPSAIALKEEIDIAKKTGIGKTAMDFIQNDTLGKPVSLSSFKGSYVLVDFWASWCGPCRAENPNVVKVYNKYHGQGFNILGVSLDRETQKERWLKAIHDDQLTWTHVSDLKYWDNAVAVMYGIKAIPQNLLIDPDGKIIAKNLRGEDLEKKLEQLIDYKKTY